MGAHTADEQVQPEETQEVRRSFALRMIVAVLGLVATLLTSVLAVRALDVRSAAAFLGVLAALMLGPALGRLGLGQNAIRAVAAATSPAEVATQVVAHLRGVAVLSLLTAPVVAWLATAIVTEDRLLVVALVTAMIVLESLRLTASDVHAATGRIRWSVAGTHHSRSIIALLVLAVVVLVQDRTTLVTLLTVYAAVSLALLLAVSVRLPVRGQAARTGRWWVPMLAAVAAGAQLFAVELGAFLVGRANVWLAGWAFTSEDALLYSTASVLAMQVTVLEGLANIALTPVAARLWAEGRRDRVFALLRASATVSTLITVVLVAAVWLLAPQVLSIYGEGLDGAAVELGVLATGGLGMSLFGSCAVLLVVSGRGRVAATAVAVAVLIAVPAAVLAAVFGGPLELAIAGAVGTALLFGSYAVACRSAFGEAPLPGLRVKQSLLVLAGRGPAEDDATVPVTEVPVPDVARAAADSPGVAATGPSAGGAA